MGKGVIPVGMKTPLLMLLSACAQLSVDGEVVDATGAPVSDVQIAVQHTACAATTTRTGRFSLACEPGKLDLSFSHPEFFSHQIAVTTLPRAAQTLPKTTLVRRPTKAGLYIFDNDRYISLSTGMLRRDTQTKGAAKRRSYCLDRSASTPNATATGPARFADKNAKPWRLFRLDAQGCAYRDARDAKGRWVVEYRDRPALSREASGDGMAIVEGQLDKGDYFLADWSGFFVEDAPDQGRYTGRWIRVDG